MYKIEFAPKCMGSISSHGIVSRGVIERRNERVTLWTDKRYLERRDKIYLDNVKRIQPIYSVE